MATVRDSHGIGARCSGFGDAQVKRSGISINQQDRRVLVKIGVLGPLSIDHNRSSIVPTAGKPRQVLAMLALRAGHTVPVSTLMEEVWGNAVPRSAATTLQTYILQLRRQI